MSDDATHGPGTGFVDDLEFLLRPEQGRIAMRAASRLGYWDPGANRRRPETLRRALEGAL